MTELKLNELFQSGMVLQQGKRMSIWGQAEPGSGIRAEIQGQKKEAAASEDGSFEVWLDPLTASEEESLLVTDGRSKI